MAAVCQIYAACVSSKGVHFLGVSRFLGVSVGGFGILARSWLESASPELVSTPQNAVRISNAAILEISPQ